MRAAMDACAAAIDEGKAEKILAHWAQASQR
jgi:hypothetical protein